jgi:MFS family permease
MAQGVAQSWLVLKLTGSAFLLSLTATATMAPSLVGSAWAGSLVDRYDRRHALAFTQSSFILLSTGLGVLVATGNDPVWVVFVFAFVAGIISMLDGPARQVLVVDLVGKERLASAVGLYEVVLNTSRVLGPALGGALLATVGVAVCFFVNAVTFVLPLGVVVALLYRPSWAAVRASRGERGRGHVREGLTYAWRMPAIRSCLLMAVAGGMLFNMSVTLPLMATRAFHAGPEGYGTMMAAFGFGALFGATLAGSGPTWPSGRRVRVLALATGAEICLAATAPGIAWLYVGMGFAGFLSIWFIALANALVQIRAEPEMRGRVMGLWSMALPGMSPITSLLIGGVATWGGGALGAREAFGLAGVALMISAAIGWRAMADRDAGGNAPTRPDSAPNSGFAVANEGDCVLPSSGTTSAGPAAAAR